MALSTGAGHSTAGGIRPGDVLDSPTAPMSAGAGETTADKAAGETTADEVVEESWEYNLRKYLLLLATMVGTITYTAGFTPPGGVWQDSDAASGRLAGDPILRDTSYRRYLAFFYTNAAAFGSSLVVIVLVLILSYLHEKKNKNQSLAPLHILRFVMVLDFFSLMAAYAAGTCRDKLTSVYSSVLVFLVALYVIFQMARAAEMKENDKEEEKHELQKDLKKRRKRLMVLATFAVSVTYLAGLSAPGGFWADSEGGHQPGVAVLKGRQDARLAAFFLFNTTAFVASLLVIVRLLDSKLRLKPMGGKLVPYKLHIFIIVVLIGLVGAYASGSSRQIDTSIKVSILVGAAVLAFIFVVQRLISRYVKESRLWKILKSLCSYTSDEQRKASDGEQEEQKNPHEKARSLVLLLATLAATITYQAGLDPPGGLWEENGDGYLAGDPILLSTNPRRYRAFFYCNSVAFVASLLAIILAKFPVLHQHHALEAAMVLDLFGLIGAYAAGSCRDVTTSVYAIALAGAVLVYVVIHVVFFTMDHEQKEINREMRRFLEELKEANAFVEQWLDRFLKERNDANALVEKWRKRLLLCAILAATITYQAGLTPPSGFRLLEDESGHHAGDPVLLYNYPRRYKTFFYCNSVSFMLSIALIILLVNPTVYRPAIRSNALFVCTTAGMLSLLGAYAAGSTQHLKTSIYIFVLVVVVMIFIVGVVVFFAIRSRDKKWSGDHGVGKPNWHPLQTILRRVNKVFSRCIGNPDTQNANEGASMAAEGASVRHHQKLKYVMLLGILVASVTYQAGLKPPGGMWKSDGIEHAAGYPIMYHNRRQRYHAFFYINSTSFVASIIVIILVLLESLQKNKWWCALSGLNTTIALDLLGLLLAYAVGSSRSWKTSGIVLGLVIPVLAYVCLHALLSHYARRDPKAAKKEKSGDQPSCAGALCGRICV